MAVHDPVRLRDAVAADSAAIAAFQTQCWREAYRGLVPDDDSSRTDEVARGQRWLDGIASGARKVCLAEAAGRIVGVVSWGDAEEESPSLELKSLYVADAHRETGVADLLVHHALRDHPARLWVFEENPRERGFYRRLGFVPDGARKLDPDTGVPEIRMVRTGAGG